MNCVFWNMGENCSSGSRLIVHRKLKDKLLARMLEVSKEWIVGDPLDPATKVGPMIEESHMKKVLGLHRERQAAKAPSWCWAASAPC